MRDDYIPVTTILRIQPLSGKEEECLQWMNRVSFVASSFDGHQGYEIFKTTTGPLEFVNTFRFNTQADLLDWESSEELKELLVAGKPFIEVVKSKELLSGLEFWFENSTEASTAPPRYKMAAIMVVMLFAFQYTLIPAIQQGLGVFGLPQFIKSLLGLCAVVGIITWVAMPFVVKVLAFWLFPAKAK